MTPRLPLAAFDSDWPDAVDGAGIFFFLAFAFGLPLLGYVAMYVDFRRYLRSLRRCLVVVTHAIRPGMPYWVLRDRPPCLVALELDGNCSEDQVIAAYRRRVKLLHPDHGGDLQQFLKLQKHFEQALYLVRNRKP